MIDVTIPLILATASKAWAFAPTLFGVLSSIVATASAIAAVTPNPKDDSVVGIVRKYVDWLALNIGHAKK